MENNGLKLSPEQTIEVIGKINHGDDKGAVESAGMDSSNVENQSGDILQKVSKVEDNSSETKSILSSPAFISMGISSAVTAAVAMFKKFSNADDESSTTNSLKNMDNAGGVNASVSRDNTAVMNAMKDIDELDDKNERIAAGVKAQKERFAMEKEDTSTFSLSNMIFTIKDAISNTYNSVKGFLSNHEYIKYTVIATIGAVIIYTVYKIYNAFTKEDVESESEAISESYIATSKFVNAALNEDELVADKEKTGGFIEGAMDKLEELWSKPMFRNSVYAGGALLGLSMGAVLYNKYLCDVAANPKSWIDGSSTYTGAEDPDKYASGMEDAMKRVSD